MILLRQLFSFLAKPSAGRSSPEQEIAALRAEVARLGREQSRAITLLEARDAVLDELAGAWQEQLTGREVAQMRQAQEEDQRARTMVEQLLPVADALRHSVEAALRLEAEWQNAARIAERRGGGTALDGWLQGVLLVEQRLQAVLEHLGAQPIPTLGSPFDPRLHLVVAMVHEGGVAEGAIAGEERRGYTLGKRVLRHAEVVVARHGSVTEGLAEKEERQS